MIDTKKLLALITGMLLAISGRAEVRVFIQDSNGVALVKYQCTAGEIVRAFALNVSVDQGHIIGVSDFFRGPGTAESTGYGIFPASFRDHLAAAGINVDWSSSDYTPLAVVTDSPADTLPGLNSTGVTLELGGLWDPNVPSAVPGPAGTLCSLQLSQPARVSVAANLSRAGVVSAFAANVIAPVFISSVVGNPTVTSATLQNGLMTILFQGGQLQTAPSVDGPWTDTGDVSGDHVENLGASSTRFYRVRSP
jgi:hypothetical protein